MTVPILAVSDDVWKTLIGAVVTITLAWMAHKLSTTAKVVNDVHTLVNSNFGIQLKLHAVTARRLASFTEQSEDLKAADLAEKMLAEHEAKQSIVDNGKK